MFARVGARRIWKIRSCAPDRFSPDATCLWLIPGALTPTDVVDGRGARVMPTPGKHRGPDVSGTLPRWRVRGARGRHVRWRRARVTVLQVFADRTGSAFVRVHYRMQGEACDAGQVQRVRGLSGGEGLAGTSSTSLAYRRLLDRDLLLALERFGHDVSRRFSATPATSIRPFTTISRI